MSFKIRGQKEIRSNPREARNNHLSIDNDRVFKQMRQEETHC